MLSRILFGGRISIMIGLVGTITATLVGILLGSIAGYAGGRTDNFIMRFVDILYGLPYMLVVIIMMAVFGKNVINLFVAIALVSWLTLARVVRGQVISLKNAEFVEAARSMGASPARIVFRHLTPNTLGVIVVFATLLVPDFIMSESFLSFLGLGVSAPLASWGSLVSEGTNTMELYPWQLLVPAIAMTLFLFAMNFLGDGLRDALDPQSKNRL
jgi:oligopeptide transport system permease protein